MSLLSTALAYWPLLACLVLQAVLPVAVLVWFAWRTPQSVVGFWTHIAAAMLLIIALAFVGRWTFLPWWLPYVYAVVLLLIGAAIYGGRDAPAQRWPTARQERLHLRAFAAFALACAVIVADALFGRLAPRTNAVELSFPLPAGDYLVVEGGNSLALNRYLRTLHAEDRARGADRNAEWRGLAYGIDLVAINPTGLRATRLQPRANNDYFIYDTPVLAPCDGNVDSLQDGLPEPLPPLHDAAHPEGNHVLLHCTEAMVLLAHLRPNSIKVARGARVYAGMEIARVGHSGDAAEPTLHVHAQRPGSVGSPFDGEPMVMRFGGRYFVRNDRVDIAAAKQSAQSSSPN